MTLTTVLQGSDDLLSTGGPEHRQNKYVLLLRGQYGRNVRSVTLSTGDSPVLYCTLYFEYRRGSRSVTLSRRDTPFFRIESHFWIALLWIASSR